MVRVTDHLDMTIAFDWGQGSHRLGKYSNLQDCLKKSLKIKFALKST